MKAYVLEPYLLPVAKRQHTLFGRRMLAMVFCFAALIGALLLYTGASGIAAALWFAGTIAAALLCTRLWATRGFDYDAIARRIEAEHPELQSLLITAMEQTPEGGRYQFNYLQERLIEEVVAKAVQQNWITMVSDATLKRARRLEWVAAGAFALVFLLLSKALIESSTNPPSPQVSALANVEPVRTVYEVDVSPGDIEVEQGDRLVIRARFTGKVPNDTVLLAGAQADQLLALPMKKNLEDPVFGGIIPAVNQAMVYRVDFDDQSSETYQISVFRYPELERADAIVRPPAYTGHPEESIEDTRYVDVLERSEVTLSFTLNKPVKQARLVTKTGEEIELVADAQVPNLVRATLVPTETVAYALKLVDDRERENRKPVEFLVKVRPNAAPEMKFLFPRKDSTVTALQEVRIEAEVYDDIGLLDYGMVYTLSGDEQELSLSSGEPEIGRKTVQHLLELEVLKVQPNQFIAYHLWAEDLGPNGKKRRTRSDMYFAEVRHFEEIFREMQAPPSESESEEKPKSDELVKQQKEIISATWNLTRMVDQNDDVTSQTNDLQVVRDAQQNLADTAGGLMDNMDDAEMRQHLGEAIIFMQQSVAELDTLITGQDRQAFTAVMSKEQAAYEALIRMRGREYQIIRSQSKSKGKSEKSERPEISELELKQQERLYETESQAKKEQQSQAEEEQRENLQVLNRLRELARRQDEIKDQLKETKHALELAQSEAEKERLSRELKRLEELQQELLRDVDELSRRMEEEQNRERMAQARKDVKEIREEVQETKSQIEKQELDDAVNSSARAQEKLDELKEDFRKQAAGRFDDELRAMRTEARELADKQTRIEEEVTQPSKAPSAQPRRLDDPPDEADQLGKKLADQRATAEDLVQQMIDVSREAEHAEPLLSRRLQDTVRDARSNQLESELARAEHYVEQEREDEASDSIAKASQAVQELKEGIEKAAETVLGNEAAGLRKAKETLDEVIEQLNQEMQQAAAGQGEQPTS
ncbi:MAG: hypothetical protein ACI9TH_001209, partial [Kiritimatiellia bacterium]